MTEVFDAFLRANLAAGVAILAVIAARPLVRRLAGPGSAYRLWILAPLCALAAMLPRPAAELAPAPATDVSAPWLIAWAATPSGPLFGCSWAGGLHPVEIRIRALSRPAPGRRMRDAATLCAGAAGLALAIGVWSAQPLAPPKPQVEPPPQVTMMMRLSEASLPAGLAP